MRPPSRLGSPARNKLLVRNASSFNAMVRALKQDLVASRALRRSPGAVYEVDKLSMHRLSITAADSGGGEAKMDVLAVGSPDRRGVAFGSSYPASPKRQLDVGAGGTGVAGSTDATRQSGGSGLLAAALRLQWIGGRSVGLHRGSG